MIFFIVENQLNLTDSFSLKNITIEDQILLMKTLIFKILYFLKMCLIFISSVNNFCRSDCWHDLRSEKKFVVSCPTCSKYLVRYLLSNIYSICHSESIISKLVACIHAYINKLYLKNIRIEDQILLRNYTKFFCWM